LRTWEEIETSFREMGFNRVYPPDVSIERIIADLRQDLGL